MEKTWWRKAKAGFTLLESLLVLGIVATCLLVGYLKVNYDTEQNELRFWQELDVTWRQAQASVRDTQQIIDFKFTNLYVNVSCENKQLKRIYYPKTLKHRMNAVNITVAADKHMNPTSIGLQHENGITYHIVFGFGWGVYKIEPEPKGLYRG